MKESIEGIKKLKGQLLKEKGIKFTIPELLAKSNADDPFYAGSENTINSFLEWLERNEKESESI